METMTFATIQFKLNGLTTKEAWDVEGKSQRWLLSNYKNMVKSKYPKATHIVLLEVYRPIN